MRLHRLAVTAFGPFGATQEIDFDELSAAGLFLLHGRTGAGKTSVLDAVCYALYGQVPGARQGSGLSLRSDHAEPLTPTEVVLEFTVGERRLEITRRPEQPRPKKRGTGMTREKAQTLLREYVPPTSSAGAGAGAGKRKALSRSHQEIGEEIAQLLGMSREQFCQVVLLPQGDFARFLRADELARGKLLGKLFDTGRFAAVEERLAEGRRAAEKRVAAGDERLLALAHRMAQAAGRTTEPDGHPLPEPTPGEPGLADAVLEWAAIARAGARERQDIALSAVRAAEAAHDGAQRTAEATRERAELQRRHAEARRRADGLERRRPDHDRLRELLERARAADAVVPALDLRTAAARDHHTAETTEHQARTRLSAEPGLAAMTLEPTPDIPDQRTPPDRATSPATSQPAQGPGSPEEATASAGQAAPEASRGGVASGPTGALGAPYGARDRRAESRGVGGAVVLAEADAEWLGQVERRVREELGALGAARRGEVRAEAVVREIAALEREARADDEAVEEAAEWLAGWEETHRAHQRRVEAAQEAVTRAEQLGGRIEPAERRLEAARRRDRLAGQEGQAREELLRAREGAAAARQNWLDLKEARLRGIAAELAAGLRAGEPCAVCGATEHPAPARPGAGHVDRTAEEAALADYQRAEEVREEAERARNALREARAGAEATAEGEDAAELDRALAELRTAYAGARSAAADAHAAREALDRAEGEHTRRTEQRQEAERRAAARTSHREALARERAALLADLEQARGADATVARRAARLERQAGLLARAAEGARAADAAANRLKEADARLADAAYRAGFETPEQAADAVLHPDRQREARRRLDAWQSESAAVAAELSDPRVLAAAQAPPADPVAAQTVADAATRALREVSAADAAARTRCEELDALSAQAVADARRLAPLRAEHDRIARLAALAAGTSADNERRMRLEAYVLAARLEQVAAAASVRLRHMSSGRYTLVHSDARSGGRGRSGLGLHVVDAWTGSERDTATLSGGETFSASLALALGLADVVTDEAGGVRLDTLFIDEGFGSLDEQTLDEVMDVLDSLRERDRTVGIVSHVADLRRRIPAQLEVVKGRQGSAVRHRMAAAH
ncbi:AAA family ATPase [Streptomyces iranensis]|uniref:Nuclease SbcCD subunit C n=1 Tax=Streptomyces iranensis TaxID=576784 RepID=A0A060ZFA6_9ACTN|nr:SMC family ATPase [Streptomyces iranensis]MBP2062679.1 exonuclease SbcC [Streptomyces iranensis]CDR04498.1 exonuclease [Streptomyces iranensis]